MKILFLLLITTLLAFSSEKRLILGTYSQEKHATNAFKQVHTFINQNHSLKTFLALNHLNTQIEKIDDYNVLSIKTFTSDKKLFYVLSKFQKSYPDLYVLPPYKDPIITVQKVSVKPIQKETLKAEIIKPIAPKEAITVEKPLVVKSLKVDTPPVAPIVTQEVEEEEVIPKTIEPTYSNVITKPKIDTMSLEDDILLEEEIDDTFDTTNLFNYQIAITIIIAIILIMILFNTLIKLRNSSKKKKDIM